MYPICHMYACSVFVGVCADEKTSKLNHGVGALRRITSSICILQRNI